jgi:lipooligosaccharide transport system permease protein
MSQRWAAVLESKLVFYRRAWRSSAFSSFLLPVFFLLAMGKSVGSYVDARSGLGVPYLDFIAPGVLAATALQVAMGESTYPIFSGFQWARTFYAMLATPVRISDVVLGSLAYVLIRVGIAVSGFLLVMTAFGTVHSALGVLALPAAVLLGLAAAAPTFAFAASVASDSMFAVLYRFAVIPMTLFAGVYFPVSALPLWARVLAYASPLWHGVELCRAATMATTTPWPLPAHIGYLVLWSIAGWSLTSVTFTHKLRI